eukprot:gene10836-16923_t
MSMNARISQSFGGSYAKPVAAVRFGSVKAPARTVLSRCAARSQPVSEQDVTDQTEGLSRRHAMMGAAMAMAGASFAVEMGLPAPAQARAFIAPAPQGFRTRNDKLDGYSFSYPEQWIEVTTSGNDFFVRNGRNIDENLFVDISSPSSSRFNTVNDLGSPQEAAEKLLDQLLNKEFMSTRIGIKREGSILSSAQRTGQDGQLYYDIQLQITSYASRNPYESNYGQVMKDYGVEFDRVFQTTLGTANQRLYELRLQTAKDTFEASQPLLSQISETFCVREVELVPGAPKPSTLRSPNLFN